MRGFRPDAPLAYKKPAGVAGELLTSIVELKLSRPQVQVVLFPIFSTVPRKRSRFGGNSGVMTC
jgi:hypothetical protein